MNSVLLRYVGKENNTLTGRKGRQDFSSFPSIIHPLAMQFSEALSVSDIVSFNIKNSVEVFNISTFSPYLK
jgi:hypothetical protein